MGFFGGLANVVTGRMAQKRQQDFARERDDHQAQLDMFTTAIKAAEQAGDWDKVAQFTGLLGDYTQGGSGKKGKGKRDTALHSISDALRSHVVEKPDAAAATPEQRGAALSKGLAGKAGLDELPKKKQTVGAFEEAYQKRRQESAEDEKRKFDFQLQKMREDRDIQEHNAEKRIQLHAEEQRKTARVREQAKAEGKTDALASSLLAANPDWTPEQAHEEAGRMIVGKWAADAEKTTEQVNTLRAQREQAGARLDVAKGNLAMREKEFGLRLRGQDFREWKVGHDTLKQTHLKEIGNIQSRLQKVNGDIDALMIKRAAYIGLASQSGADQAKATAALGEMTAQLDSLIKESDQLQLQYTQKVKALEEMAGAAPAPKSNIPTSIPPVPKKGERKAAAAHADGQSVSHKGHQYSVGQVVTLKDGRRIKIKALKGDQITDYEDVQ